MNITLSTDTSKKYPASSGWVGRAHEARGVNDTEHAHTCRPMVVPLDATNTTAHREQSFTRRAFFVCFSLRSILVNGIKEVVAYRGSAGHWRFTVV